MTYREEVLTDNPTLYFPFTNGSLKSFGGRQVTSSSNFVGAEPSAIADTALTFNGTSNYVKWNASDQHDYFNGSTWSAEIWFKRGDNSFTGYRELFNTFDGVNGFTLYGSQGDQAVAVWFNFTNATRTKIIGPTVTDTNWHHLAVVSDGTADTMKAYLDGVQFGATGVSRAANFAANSDMWLGAYSTSANTENWLGSMDELAIYKNIALSPTRILAHYNAKGMTKYTDRVLADSPIHYWQFDQSGSPKVGTPAVTIASGYSTLGAGRYGNAALYADGANRTGCTTTGLTDFFGSAYSIETWFNFGVKTGDSGEIFRLLDSVACEVTTGGGLLYYYGGSTVTVGSGLMDNAWHHLVITRNASRVVTIYIDKTPYAAFTAPTGTFTGTFYIGGSQYSTQAIKGRIDDFAIYNYALSQSQVNNHFDGTPVSYSELISWEQPQGYWRSEGSTAFDTMTNADFTLVGTPTVGAGKHGNAWTTNQNVAINLGGNYPDFTIDGSFSVESWFKLPTTFAATYPTIWRRDGNGVALLLRARSNTFASNLGPGCLEVYLNGVDFYSPGRYDDNQWHHVVMTVGSAFVKLYVDGVMVTSQACGTGWNVNSGAGSSGLFAGGPDPTNGEGWQGSLDEVVLYQEALSAAQVAQHYAFAVSQFRGWGIPPR